MITGETLEDQITSTIAQTYVVVVTFQPDLEVLDRQFSRLATEGMHVIVVDNCSSAQSDVTRIASRYAFDCVPLSTNEGVASAHNTGIDRARSRQGGYVVFLDQDSIPREGAFKALVRAFLSFAQDAKVAAIGSSYTLQAGARGSSFVRFGWFRFKKLYCDDAGEDLQEVDFLISSGTFIPLSVIDAVGRMQDDLFIDHVDTDWFLRVKSAGYRSYGCCSAALDHALGEHTVTLWFGRWRTVPVHKGFRYFFIFRNSLWLYRQKYAPAQWVSADLVRLLYIFVFSGLLSSSRIENLKWMCKGIKAGFRDISDPAATELVRSIKHSELN